jgi:pimeloyl-ACP methyl ester carboxylesterase
VKVPALILWARAGNFSYAHYEALAGCMAGGRVRVADTGHLVPMEDPELVVAEVLRFAQRSVG